MTYCCGILVHDALVMIADTRTNAGLDNISTFRKLHVFTQPGERVLAILDWIKANIDYEPGSSDSETTAARTFIDRAGVCRDFTHMGITLCRASGIPARAVSAYADQLQPPDFHAIFEVWLSDGWWLVDPTGLAPVEGLVRIACGRDAGDIAFLTTQAGCRLVRQSISAAAVD